MIPRFSGDKEQLAFPIRAEYDEFDHSTIFANYAKIITQTSEINSNCIEMIKCKLPISLY